MGTSREGKNKIEKRIVKKWKLGEKERKKDYEKNSEGKETGKR